MSAHGGSWVWCGWGLKVRGIGEGGGEFLKKKGEIKARKLRDEPE